MVCSLRVVLVASIGFTVDFVMRRIADLGRGGVSRVIAIGLRTQDEGSWRRVEEAFNLLSHYLKSLGIESELREARVGHGMVRSLRDALARASSLAGMDGIVEVYLTGGPRILIVALTIASLTSSPSVREKLRIVVYGEGFEGSLEIPVEPLARLLTLDEDSSRILSEIARLGSVDAKSLMQILDIKRSTLYKKLKDMTEHGLVVNDSGAWRIHRSIEEII